ncbi:ABC transporter ATP-binding protein [Nocardioidaceae bacterium SCSIO 66511]|nr:ABC transporter ATP-binding protein [Nocardioidaceae bacterium SCSIO 66511]
MAPEQMTGLGTAAPRLEITSLNKTFERRGEEIEVLQEINLTVAAGEFVAIVGASGCGKTTLARIVDGLEHSTSGTIRIDGEPPNGAGRDQNRGFVFQKDNLLPWRTVLDNVGLGLELQRRPSRERRATAQKYLDLVGLGSFSKHYPHEISGGMKQRANLARAFSIEPEILLMDEPFAALDAQTREIMQTELLRVWNESNGGSVLFITHQIDEALFLANRVVVLTARPGRIKEIIEVPFERPRTLEIKRSPEFGALYDRIWKMIEEEVRDSMEVG